MFINKTLDDGTELLYAAVYQVEPQKIVNIAIIHQESDYHLHIIVADAYQNNPFVEVYGNAEQETEIQQLFQTTHWEKIKEICVLMAPTFTLEEMKNFCRILDCDASQHNLSTTDKKENSMDLLKLLHDCKSAYKRTFILSVINIIVVIAAITYIIYRK